MFPLLNIDIIKFCIKQNNNYLNAIKLHEFGNFSSCVYCGPIVDLSS